MKASPRCGAGCCATTALASSLRSLAEAELQALSSARLKLRMPRKFACDGCILHVAFFFHELGRQVLLSEGLQLTSTELGTSLETAYDLLWLLFGPDMTNDLNVRPIVAKYPC